jgi:hypothetical protein
VGKLVLAAIAALAILFGLRLRSQWDLDARARDYQHALQVRALAVRPGLESSPSREEVQAAANALAQELRLSLRDLTVSVEGGATPIGAGAMAAEALGEVKGHESVDAEGNVTAGPSMRLHSTVIRVRAQVHGEGFLCSLDRAVSASANFGYALR